jgi:putative flavoprotein involved in K+ transport
MRAAIEVVVIGAGPAGLSCAAELGRLGVGAVVLEASERVGARWHGHYDRLRLNTSRWLSRLRGTRYPRGTGMFPARDEVVRHFQNHVERHAIDVRTSTRVDRLDREGDVWIVRTSNGDLRARHVVVATGLYNVPVIPAWPGRDRFRGTLLHSAEYRNASPFVGQSVLVVGPGSSGMEIAHELAQFGASAVRLAVRTPPNILLRSIAGIPGDPAALLLLRLPTRLADAFMRGVRRLTIGDLHAHGIATPAEGPFAQARRDGTAPSVVDREVIAAIRSGRIEVVPAVEALFDSGARLADGRHLDVDAIVAATGYRPGLEPLVGHLGVLDEHGRPRQPAGDEAAPGLRFLGYLAVPGLFHDVAKRAPGIARAIAEDRSDARERAHAQGDERETSAAWAEP